MTDRRHSDRSTDRRRNDRRHLDVRPDGSVQHRANVRWWLAQMAPAPRVQVERRSLTDPFCVASEATARGSRAAA